MIRGPGGCTRSHYVVDDNDVRVFRAKRPNFPLKVGFLAEFTGESLLTPITPRGAESLDNWKAIPVAQGSGEPQGVIEL